MDLTKYLNYNIDTVRKMSKTEIYKMHQNTVIPPEGMTYNDVVNRMEYLMKKIKFTPTSEQLHAILSSFEGYPIVIEAVPGAGKTTVTTFICLCDNLIWNVDKYKMLLTSFSNESSAGMQEKNIQFARAIGCEPINRIKTMHSWYYNFLREYKQYTPIPNSVAEIETLSMEDATNMLRSTYVDIVGNKAVTSVFISQLYAVYSYIYDAMIQDDEEAIKNLRLFKELDMEYDVFKKVIKQFNSAKLVFGKIDFTDMQVLFKDLLEKHDAVRNKIAKCFDLILIDEAQDTSKLQLTIYTLLTNDTNRKRFRLVGDNDQSIYRWRGTSKTIFKDIFERFPEAKLLTLGYNMRSTDSIIEAGNNLIKHNPNRVDKKMVSPRGLKGDMVITPCKSRMEAVDFVYGQLKQVYEANKGNYNALKEHCVLVRNHNQGLWLVDKLLGDKIPIRLLGGYFPYNDKIIQDLTDIMSAVLSPRDSKLGSIAIPKLCADVKSNQSKQVLMQMSLGKALYEVQFDAIPTKYNPEPTFVEDMKVIKRACELNNPTVAQLCQLLIPLYRTGSYDFYAKKQSIDPEHYESIFEYLLEQHISLDAFLLRLNNIRAQLKNSDDLDIGFRLCSMHAAKGREYDSVYLLDCSARTCPSELNLNNYKASDAYDYLIEERNLFYVAITRARYNLYVTYNKFSPSIFNKESGLIKKEDIRYVKPLPQKLLDYIAYTENSEIQRQTRELGEATQMRSYATTNKSATSRQTQTSKSNKPKNNSTNLNGFIPKFVLNEYYSNILQNLKF